MSTADAAIADDGGDQAMEDDEALTVRMQQGRLQQAFELGRQAGRRGRRLPRWRARMPTGRSRRAPASDVDDRSNASSRTVVARTRQRRVSGATPAAIAAATAAMKPGQSSAAASVGVRVAGDASAFEGERGLHQASNSEPWRGAGAVAATSSAAAAWSGRWSAVTTNARTLRRCVPEPVEVGDAQLPDAPGRQQAVDGAHAEAGHAQQALAARPVDVDGKALGMRQRPGQLRIDGERQHAVLGDDLVLVEAVEAQQPVGLVEPVFAHQRRRRAGSRWLACGVGLKAE